jgi:hypothetical protein
MNDYKKDRVLYGDFYCQLTDQEMNQWLQHVRSTDTWKEWLLVEELIQDAKLTKKYIIRDFRTEVMTKITKTLDELILRRNELTIACHTIAEKWFNDLQKSSYENIQIGFHS